MLTEKNSFTFPYTMDPGDMADFRVRFSLDEGETIQSFTLINDASSVALGLTMETEGACAPLLVEDDSAILVWLSIDPSKQSDVAFEPGVLLGFNSVITTTNAPPRRYERAFSVLVKEGGRS